MCPKGRVYSLSVPFNSISKSQTTYSVHVKFMFQKRMALELFFSRLSGVEQN